ncbi:MAG: DNA/RNA non-specific endonuclease [Candidatus Cryptobacteroides sp.]
MSSTEVTLSGSYSGASAKPGEVGFFYGTSSSSMTEYVIATDNGGTFTARLSGLKPGQKYVFMAYAKVSGTGTYASQSSTFYATTILTYFQMPGGAEPAVDKDWLELPTGMDDDSGRYVVNTTYSGERNYTHLYDTQMMTSLWTAYPLSSSQMGSLERPGSWSYNPDIPQQYQVKVTSSSYGSTGYSRGHMCPNASRNGISTMQKQTFYVTNQVPQRQDKFNATIWANLEGAVQGVGKSEEIYVVTGVAFNKAGESRTINYISPSADASQKVPIPNYFYKVVLRVKYSGTTITDACTVGFWFEHKDYSDSAYGNYTVSVDQIEQWTGFDFFVNLPDDIEEAAESKSTNWNQFKAW